MPSFYMGFMAIFKQLLLKCGLQLFFFVASAAGLLFVLPSLGADPPKTNGELMAPTFTIKIIGEKKHDPRIFTQALFFDHGLLYESSGLYGRSAFYVWDFTGDPKLLKAVSLPLHVFAEGATMAEGHIYLLSWREGGGFMLDSETLQEKGRFTYQGEGWGLCYDGQYLWRSDGSFRLWRHQLGDFAQIGEPLLVKDGQRPVPLLNELEYDHQSGLIIANVFMSTKICAIDPATGQVKFWLDAQSLLNNDVVADVPSWAGTADAVLNGLALAEDGQSMWLSGKLWNRLYQIKWPPQD